MQTNERKAKDSYSQLRAIDVKLKETLEQLKKLKKGILSELGLFIPKMG